MLDSEFTQSNHHIAQTFSASVLIKDNGDEHQHRIKRGSETQSKGVIYSHLTTKGAIVIHLFSRRTVTPLSVALATLILVGCGDSEALNKAEKARAAAEGRAAAAEKSLAELKTASERSAETTAVAESKSGRSESQVAVESAETAASVTNEDSQKQTGNSADTKTDGWEKLPSTPGYGLIEVTQIYANLDAFNAAFAGEGMNERFIKQFGIMLNAAIKAAEERKMDAAEFKDNSFVVITSRMKDMVDSIKLKRELVSIKAQMRKNGVSDERVEQFETCFNDAIEAASAGRFSLREHKEKSFSHLFQRAQVMVLRPSDEPLSASKSDSSPGKTAVPTTREPTERSAGDQFKSLLDDALRGASEGDFDRMNELLGKKSSSPFGFIKPSPPTRSTSPTNGDSKEPDKPVKSPLLRTLIGHLGAVNALAVSHDGKTLASASEDKTIKLWDVETGAEKATLEGSSTGLTSVAFSPDDLLLVTGSDEPFPRPNNAKSGEMRLWDVQTQQVVRTIDGFISTYGAGAPWGYGVESVAFSPDGKAFVGVASHGAAGKVCDTRTGEIIRVLNEGQSSRVAFSPNGKLLATGGRQLWDFDSGKLRLNLKDEGFVEAQAFSPNGKLLATANTHVRYEGFNEIRVWDIETGEVKWRQNAFSVAIAFSPDGNTLATSVTGTQVNLWDTETGKEVGSFDGHRGSVRTIVFSPDGTKLFTGSADDRIRVWNVVPRARGGARSTLPSNADSKEAEKPVKSPLLRTLIGHFGAVNALAVSHDGKTLASASEDKTIKLWDVETGAEKTTLEGSSTGLTSVAFSPDDLLLVTGSDEPSPRPNNAKSGEMKLWDLQTQQVLRTIEGFITTFGTGAPWGKGVKSVAFSPDGKTFVGIAGDVDDVKVCKTETGKFIQAIKAGECNSVAVSPDGKSLATGGGILNHGVRIWDFDSGKLRLNLKEDGRVEALAYSPNGKLLATANTHTRYNTSEIRIWDLETGEVKWRCNAWSVSVAFSPDGNTLATSVTGTQVNLWDTETGKEIGSFDGHRDYVRSIVFSRDGTKLFTGSADDRIRVWNVSSRVGGGAK